MCVCVFRFRAHTRIHTERRVQRQSSFPFRCLLNFRTSVPLPRFLVLAVVVFTVEWNAEWMFRYVAPGEEEEEKVSSDADVKYLQCSFC